MTHPNHETALMLLRAAGFSEDFARRYLNGEYPVVGVVNREFTAMAAAVDAREKAMRDLLERVAKFARSFPNTHTNLERDIFALLKRIKKEG